MAQDQMDSAKRKENVSREPGCSHAVSGSRNDGVGNLAGCPIAVPGLPFLCVAAAAHGLPKCSLHEAAA